MRLCLKDLRYTYALLYLPAAAVLLSEKLIIIYRLLQVKFNQFVEQGRVLHNYASILELLLRLRQCCDHPFLVMRFSSGSSEGSLTLTCLI